jgi:hypothetical protein
MSGLGPTSDTTKIANMLLEDIFSLITKTSLISYSFGRGFSPFKGLCHNKHITGGRSMPRAGYESANVMCIQSKTMINLKCIIFGLYYI